MANAPSTVPARNPAGYTTASPYSPLACSGYGDPTYYHEFFDDFDASVLGAWYTVSTTNSGTLTQGALDGGVAVFTTGASSGNYEAIQTKNVSFSLPGTTGKKLFYGARFQLSNLTSNAILGLGNINATIFGGDADLTDGIWFYHATGGTTVNLITAASGAYTTHTIPTANYSLVAATNIDVAFYIDRHGDLFVYIGAQLFGYVPQWSSAAVLGPALQLAAGTWTAPTAVLAVTAGVQTEASSAYTMSLDFHYCQKER